MLCRRPPTSAWTDLADLDDLLSLPLDLERNAEKRFQIFGDSLASRLEKFYAPADRIEVRIVAQDRYQSVLQTPILELKVKDLREVMYQ
jgi:hypothetical protein